MVSCPEQAAKRRRGGASAADSTIATKSAAHEWHVHKFGGTSVGDASCFRKVQGIIGQVALEGVRPAIVVSAMGGKPKTTDMLIKLTTHAEANDWDAVEAGLASIRSKHESCLRDLFGEGSVSYKSLTAVVEKDLGEIISLLRAVTVMRLAPVSIVGIVSGYGEQWSAQFLQKLLAEGDKPWVYLDARQVLVIEGEAGSDVAINWSESAPKVRKFLEMHADQNLVITGFIASTRSGGSTTLGRDGSDFSATVFGRLLDASEVTIWTDVSGVLSADPRKVSDAYCLPEVSYKEAAELAYFGAKVVHPKTMIPAYSRSDRRPDAWGAGSRSIPIFIKNTFAPLDPGTRIFESREATRNRPECVCGFTEIDGMALVSVEGLGMQGCPGVAARLFQALQAAGISIVMIAQASSEVSINYLVAEKDGELAKTTTLQAFAREREVGFIETVEVISPCAVVAAVGDAMPTTVGVAGKFFNALGQAGINILAIAQGRNQRNISAVVAASHSNKALQALHAAFLTITPLAIAVIGAGAAAEAFLTCIGSSAKEIAEEHSVDMRVVAVFDPLDRHGKLAVAEASHRLDPRSVLSKLAEQGTTASVHTLVDHLSSSPQVHKVIVDCSDSKDMASNYRAWLERGFYVVTQNCTDPSSCLSTSLSTSASPIPGLLSSIKRILCSAAVGRGLPILPTLGLLRECCDPVTRVDGVFSASMNYICSRVLPVDGSEPLPFADAAQLASELGIFGEQKALEMTGQLAKLQLLLLARELRFSDSDFQVEVEPITEAALLREGDSKTVLRYAGSLDVDTKRGAIRLVSVPRNHPFAQLPSNYRMTRFFTQKRGPENPVVVSGPVGGSLIADALLADCLQLGRRLAGRSNSHAPMCAKPWSDPPLVAWM